MKARGCAYRFVQAIVLLFLLILLIAWAGFIWPFTGLPFEASRHGHVPLTPPWALECWAYEDDVNTADAVKQILAGYEQYDIPLRTVILDSPWSTRYNDFTIDEKLYPNPKEFFGDLQSRGYRVVLWMTTMVDSSSKDTSIRESRDWFEEAKSKGYLAGDGVERGWWKGHGGWIDYTNPDAMKWWHGLQDQVYALGIDGWKLDGSDTLLFSRLGPVPIPYVKTRDGWLTTRQYMDHYDRDEYAYGLSKNPDFVVLDRSLDRYAHIEGFAPFDAAPVCWVGDNDHAWLEKDEGIEEALTDVLRSAKLGYCVVGSEVAGYSGKEIQKDLYIRWAQFSTFCGLFLNGGHGLREPWKRSPEELEIYRKFAWLHTELIPYIYSHVKSCHNGGAPLMKPLSAKYHYLFGDDFLVAPIYEDTLTRQVTLPDGNWRYLFNDDDVTKGPTTFTREFPLNEFPVYVRDGAIIPMHVARPYTGYGDKTSANAITVLVYPHGHSEFTVAHTDSNDETTIKVTEGNGISIQFSGAHMQSILRVKLPSKPKSITVGKIPLPEGTDWTYDGAHHILIFIPSPDEQGPFLIN